VEEAAAETETKLEHGVKRSGQRRMGRKRVKYGSEPM
jgi:hypothetical protein